MKSDRGDMRAEYDFSGAKRSKYAAKLNDEERAELVRRSASLDAQYWFGHAIQRIQELEALVVAYLTLALDRAPGAAGSEAAALLEGQGAPSLSRLAAAMSASGPRSADFESRFKNMIRERSWLIHKGGFALSLEGKDTRAMVDFVNRLAGTADEATELGASLRATIEERLAEAGLSSDEVRQRTDEVIQRWLAA
jgi:hypothetical protein